MLDLGIGFFPRYRLFVIALVAVVLLVLWLTLEKTRIGLIVRAGARDPTIMQVLGVDIGRVWLAIFGLGVGLAALGGVLAGPMRSVNPEMGSLVLAEAFVVTVIGGLGSIVGAVVAGLMVGISISLVALFAPEMATIVMFALMAVVLLIRPQGLFGVRGGPRDVTIERRSGRQALVQRASAGFSSSACCCRLRCWPCCPGCCRRRRWPSTS